MKKIISLTLLAAICIFALASCFGGGIPNGTYESESGQEIVVSGNKMKMTQKYGSESMTAVITYKLNDDKTELTVTDMKYEYDGDDDTIQEIVDEMNEEVEENFEEETSDFELGDDYFEIDGIKYTKK